MAVRGRWRKTRLALLAVAAIWPGAAAAGGPSEAAIEATYLYKFAPFVSWPDAAATGPLTVCVVGDDPFGPLLDRAVAGQTLSTSQGTRGIEVAHIETIGPRSTCDIAYLGGSRAQNVAEALRAVRGAPILTVTDDDDPPGIIAFVVADGHVRFKVDQIQAKQNGLAISSKLLSLALAVRSAPGQVEP
jgi:hypothetical protein